MQKSLHHRLSRKTSQLINAEKWSSEKDMICSTRSEIDTDSFTESGQNVKKERITLIRNEIFQ